MQLNPGRVRELRCNDYHKHREKRMEQATAWKEKNKEYQKEYRKKRYKLNIVRNCQYSKDYRLKNRTKISQGLKKYHKNNKDKINKHLKQKRRTNIQFKLSQNIRSRIWNALKNNYNEARTAELIGWSSPQLKKHIEFQFQGGMSWDNWNLKGWHIDHIIPCSAFDLSKPEEQLNCFNYINLQPLWAFDNISKGGVKNSTV